MASLQELKKRLVSVQTAGKLATAMKTVSTAKFSQANKLFTGFSPCAEVCSDLLAQFSSAFSELFACKNSNAPACYVIFAAEQSLCGSYNAELFSFLEDKLNNDGSARFLTCGKTARAFFSERGKTIFREYETGDVPSYEDCLPVCDDVRKMYADGEISSVSIVYMKMVNSMVQTPACRQILPLSRGNNGEENDMMPPLFVPDRQTVLDTVGVKALNSLIYSTLLESAVSLQAATRIAMSSACDNADETAKNLEVAIHQKRQGAITASVLETSSDILQKEDD